MLDFLIKFLAIIGLIIILSYLISYLYSYYKERAANTANRKINPPPSYMQNSGVKCPDYFSHPSSGSESYNCSNRDFNLNVQNDPKCYSNSDNKIIEFPKLPDGKTWEYGDPDGLTSMSAQERYDWVNTSNSENVYSRCDWIKNCGPSNGVKGVWQGIERICNSPNPSQGTLGST